MIHKCLKIVDFPQGPPKLIPLTFISGVTSATWLTPQKYPFTLMSDTFTKKSRIIRRDGKKTTMKICSTIAMEQEDTGTMDENRSNFFLHISSIYFFCQCPKHSVQYFTVHLKAG